MNQEKYIIEILRPEEKNNLFEFYRENLTSGEEVIEYYNWRDLSDLQISSNRTVIAKFENKIVGTLNSVPVSIQAGERLIKAAWQGDTIVKQEMRGKGIAKTMLEKASDGYELVLAKGSSNPMYNLRKSVGFTDVINSNYLIKVLTPLKRKDTVKRRFGYFVYFFISISRKPVLALNSTFEEISGFDSLSDDFFRTLNNDNSLQIEKSRQYLDWRYPKCPQNNYKIVSLSISGKKRGAIILKLNRTKGESLWLVDLLCNVEDQECIKSLLWTAFRYAKLNNSSDIRIFSTCSKLRKVLFKYGFNNTMFTPHFTYRCIDRKIEEIIRDKEWIFFHGDGDVELYDA
jgi:hypothetical protein